MKHIFAIAFIFLAGCSSDAADGDKWDLGGIPDVPDMGEDVAPDMSESPSGGVCEGRLSVEGSDLCWVNQLDALQSTMYYFGGGWLALFGSAELFSEDLVSWESVGDGKRRLVVMQDESGLYASSPEGVWKNTDGKSWELISDQELVELERSEDIWLGITPQEHLVSSSNGVDWAVVEAGVVELERVEEDFFAIRTDSSELIRSADGQIWTVVGPIEDSGLYGVGSVLYKNRSYSESLVSTDGGETWQEVMPIVGRERFASYYVGIGPGGLHRSPTGIAWEEVEQPFETRTFVVSGESLVVVGESSAAATRDFVTWTPIAEFDAQELQYLNLLEESEGVWLLCQNDCKRSNDFENWEVLEGVPRSTLVHGNGVWLMSKGDVLERSMDGQNWEAVPGDFSWVDYFEGKFYARRDRIVLESEDGLAWTESALAEMPGVRLQGELLGESDLKNSLRQTFQLSPSDQLNMACSDSRCVLDRRQYILEGDEAPESYWFTEDGESWREVVANGRIYHITFQRGSFWAGETFDGVDYLVRSDDAEDWERVTRVPAPLTDVLSLYAIGSERNFISYAGMSGFFSEPY